MAGVFIAHELHLPTALASLDTHNPLCTHPWAMRTMLRQLKYLSFHCPHQLRSLARLPGSSAGFTSRSCSWHLFCALVEHLLMVHVVGVPSRVAPCP